MAKLVIVESPAKAKTIEKYLGNDYRVKASMGHLRDLPKKKMGVDLDTFEPDYIPIDGKDELIEELMNAAEKSDMIYLATDPDREGEAISWHLKQLLELPDSKTQRVTFNEITKKAVTQGIENPRSIDLQLVDAQQARRILDRIVGYKLSPFLWKKIKRGLSAGRVQSVVTRMVVDREMEIRAFKPEEYWTIDLKLSADEKEFTAHFYGDENHKIELKTKEEADAVVNAAEGRDAFVRSIKRGDKRKHPAPPFTTSTLQQEASRKLGMASKKTMSVAQSLYEGVDIAGQGVTGLITYMRTDSLRLSDEAVESIRQYVYSRYGKEYIPEKPRFFKTKKDAQDAHEAIRPTNPKLAPDDIKASLTNDQYKLYKLIWSRFAACQMSEAILDTVSADILCGGYVFRASGYQVKFQGFTVLYEESRDDSEQDDAKKLPDMTEGMKLDNRGIAPEQHFTQPPARYTEASLIKAMEECGVGRPSTYAPTISTILDRDYVVKEAKSLKPTPLGEVVTNLMKERFKDIIDIEFTASMENKLDDVEAGKVRYKALLADFYRDFDEELKTAEEQMTDVRIKIPDEPTDIVCELCGRNMVKKSGRFGKFLACPGYPECKNTKSITEETDGICPVCGNKIVKKKSKSGYAYYGCEKFPTCTFMTWDTPLKKLCPECGNTLFKRYTKAEKKILCLKEDCGYFEELKTKSRKKDESEAENGASETQKRGRKKVEGADSTEAGAKETKKTTKRTSKKAKTDEGAVRKTRATKKQAAKSENGAEAARKKRGRKKKEAEEE